MTLEKDEVRIIPAYAGSTPASTATAAAQRDHPRIRGKHRDIRRPLRLLRLDHPRIRGEHPPVYADGILRPGSSPHTRGAPPRRLDVHVCKRIIPAYAGSTLRNAYKLTKLEDHPRIRGEHVAAFLA